MDDRQLPCPACAEDRLFVQPPCVDGHTEDGGECPEWACADCGTAVFLGRGAELPAPPAARRAA